MRRIMIERPFAYQAFSCFTARVTPYTVIEESKREDLAEN